MGKEELDELAHLLQISRDVTEDTVEEGHEISVHVGKLRHGAVQIQNLEHFLCDECKKTLPEAERESEREWVERVGYL